MLSRIYFQHKTTIRILTFYFASLGCCNESRVVRFCILILFRESELPKEKEKAN